ncbi:TetR/AcrR family transcriptional regulator [Bdellovibrio sp. SKB1291214]|uniref:TetR/AcrR family transcriptional regulator n=1 Tax=Bdellovibrio sp. SKB1291214 TaxID=1732569 RepID=UPI000B51D350|nr:TetR/AcrR family transcriptional regulator [Bdellovibrio sp. SKB1291214]UYL09026.1 TetR/AcrR family transcriptional regulator [Bdellovibrio sp. SKB1291214]
METKAQALEIAKNHLQLRGYNGFSFQDIADELGIRKASLHYYFASKEDLGLALIEDYIQSFQQWSEMHEDREPLEKIKKFIDMYNSFSQDGLKVCPGGVFCIDYNTLPAKLKKSVCQLQEQIQNWLTHVVTEGIKNKSLKTTLKPKETATLIHATTQGALQIGRMQNNTKAMKATSLALLTLLQK